MQPRSLEAFLAVVDTGSITRAAELLGRSQPTISRTLQELEAELGFELLNRLGRQVQLTEEGLIFEEEARRLLLSFGELREKITNIASGKGRAFQVAATAAISNGILPDVIDRLPADQTPHEICIAQYLPPVVAHEVRIGRVDLGFCSLPVDMRGLTVIRAFSSQFVAALPEDDPLARAETMPIAALRDRRLVTMLRSLRVPRLIAREMTARRIEPRQIIRANVSYSALQLVQRAGAVAIVDPVSAYGISVPGVVIRPLDIGLDFVWGAIAPSQFPMRAVATRFVEQAEQVARERIPGLRCHDPADLDALLQGSDGDAPN